MDEEKKDETKKPKPPRKYTETGEPENKGVMLAVGISCFLVLCVFTYFMFFHFYDTFFQRVVVEY